MGEILEHAQQTAKGPEDSERCPGEYSEPFQHGRSPQGWSQRVCYVHVKLYHKHSVSGAHCVQTLISVSAPSLRWN